MSLFRITLSYHFVVVSLFEIRSYTLIRTRNIVVFSHHILTSYSHTNDPFYRYAHRQSFATDTSRTRGDCCNQARTHPGQRRNGSDNRSNRIGATGSHYGQRAGCFHERGGLGDVHTDNYSLSIGMRPNHVICVDPLHM